MILNTLSQVGAYRSYAPSLLHIYLAGKGSLKKVHRRGSTKVGLLEKIRRRRSDREDPTKEGPL